MADIAELTRRFVTDARHHRARAPFHAAMCAAAASDRHVVGLLRHAPEEQQLPVLLMAAVHYIVLSEPSLELARHYPTTTAVPPESGAAEAFVGLCHDQADRIADIVATHRTQTNEVGRSALLLTGLALVEPEPIGLIDVGTSAGLNLLLDRFRYDYRPGGTVGPRSTVHLVCDLHGDVPVPTRVPPVASRLGIDAAPIDLADPDQRRWLIACVWPDQADRFERLRAAIEIAANETAAIETAAVGPQGRPEIVRADAVEAIGAAVAATDAHPVVLTSWVLAYLTEAGRSDFVAELDRVGHRRDISWVHVESPDSCDGVPFAAPVFERHLTAVTLVTWRSGRREVRHIGSAHPHGYWLRR
jgi:hypothetical protein